MSAVGSQAGVKGGNAVEVGVLLVEGGSTFDSGMVAEGGAVVTFEGGAIIGGVIVECELAGIFSFPCAKSRIRLEVSEITAFSRVSDCAVSLDCSRGRFLAGNDCWNAPSDITFRRSVQSSSSNFTHRHLYSKSLWVSAICSFSKPVNDGMSDGLTNGMSLGQLMSSTPCTKTISFSYFSYFIMILLSLVISAMLRVRILSKSNRSNDIHRPSRIKFRIFCLMFDIRSLKFFINPIDL